MQYTERARDTAKALYPYLWSPHFEQSMTRQGLTDELLIARVKTITEVSKIIYAYERTAHA